MNVEGCADPASCPVPSPADVDLGQLTSIVLPAGTPLRRGHRTRYRADLPVPPVEVLPEPEAMSRFAPIVGTGHLYAARRETAALLESVLHELVPAAPRVYWRRLTGWSLSHVTLLRPVRLIDLRDEALAELGIGRRELVATDPGHYPCTRNLASVLHGRLVGGQLTEGMLWHSRQAELHAEQGVRPLLADLLVGEQAEVAVLWPAGDAQILSHTAGPWPLDEGRGYELVRDVATLLGAPPPLTGPPSP